MDFAAQIVTEQAYFVLLALVYVAMRVVWAFFARIL